tara:strand:+ start:612 stop:1811 length:1200 start_codon:yes stop_codon:yes gene_type:complete
MANHISASAAQSALSIQELVTTMKTAGMADTAIRQTLLNDLNAGGPLFGSFRNKLKNTVKNGVEASSNGSANGKFTKAGVSQFQWVSVGDGKVCPDCEERHGETGTMEYFETIGLPASGFSVCTTNCRCQLLPENYKGENLDKPLVKEKKLIGISQTSFDSTIRRAEKLGALSKNDIDYLKSVPRSANSIKENYPILIKAIREKEASLSAPNYNRPLKKGKLVTDKDIEHLNFTKTETSSINAYTRESYIGINGYLRGTQTGNNIKSGAFSFSQKEILNHSQNISKLLSKLPNYEGDVLRTMGFSHYNWSRIKSTFDIGNIFTDKGFMSSTLSPTYQKVGGDIIVKLRIKSKTGKDISNLSAQRFKMNEAEILFDKNTSFITKSVKIEKNVYEIELWEI